MTFGPVSRKELEISAQAENLVVVSSHETLSDARRHPVLAALALPALALVWGYTWVTMKIALHYAQPFTFVWMRTCFGAVVLLVLIAVLRRPLKPPAIRWTLGVGLLQSGINLSLATLALYLGGAGRTAVLTFTMPFWLLLLGWMLLGERLQARHWTAGALALVGFSLMLAPSHLGGVLSTALAAGGGFMWAVSGVVIKVMHRQHRVDLLSFTAWQMLFGSVALIPLAALTWSGPPIWSSTFVWTLSFTVLLGNSLGWLLWLFVLQAYPASVAGMGSLAVPVVGMLGAWIQLGERPSVTDAIGMMSILVGLAIISVPIRRAINRLSTKCPPAVGPRNDASSVPESAEGLHSQ